ncbi:MAG: hypothetical protein AB8I08_09885 [Sandaracinaceae bacterium]
MGTKIDGADWHIADAGTWERASRHIGLFMLLAARHGLASDAVNVVDLERDPVDYVIREWDGVLDSTMLLESAVSFVSEEYREQYMPAYTDAVLQLGGASAYMSSAEVATRLAGGTGPPCGASLLADAPHRLVTPQGTHSRSSIRITTSASAIYADVDEAELRVQLDQVVGSLAAGFRLLDSLFGAP